MESLKIDAGVVTLLINDDPDRKISFNPEDVIFVEKFYNLMKTFAEKEGEYTSKAKQLDIDAAKDKHGLPANTPEMLQFMKDVCNFLREQIDSVFGEGTSQTVFGDYQKLNMFEQFFRGITPYVQAKREEKVKKYVKR